MLGGSLVSHDDKLFGSDEGITLGLSDGKVIDTIIRYVDGITLGLDIGTELGSLYGSPLVSFPSDRKSVVEN